MTTRAEKRRLWCVVQFAGLTMLGMSACQEKGSGDPTAAKPTATAAPKPDPSAPAMGPASPETGSAATAESPKAAPAPDDDFETATMVPMALLSSTMACKIPPHVLAHGEGVGKGLALGDTAFPSREACETRNSIRRARNGQWRIAANLCLIDAEAKGLKIGSKYRILSEGQNGDQHAHAVFSDRSDAAQIEISVCKDGKLTDRFVLTGARGEALRGSFRNLLDTGHGLQVGAGTFDNGYTDTARFKLDMESSFFPAPVGSDHTYLGFYSFDLAETGTSFARYSYRSKGKDGAFEGLGYSRGAKFTSSWGSTLFYDGSEAESGVKKATSGTPSYFDGKGRIVRIGDSPELGVGGAVHIAATELLPLIADDYQAPDFGAGEWDCAGGETIESQATAADWERCELLAKELEMEPCADETLYRYSTWGD